MNIQHKNSGRMEELETGYAWADIFANAEEDKCGIPVKEARREGQNEARLKEKGW